jgi:hypothetical protein
VVAQETSVITPMSGIAEIVVFIAHDFCTRLTGNGKQNHAKVAQ